MYELYKEGGEVGSWGVGEGRVGQEESCYVAILKQYSTEAELCFYADSPID